MPFFDSLSSTAAFQGVRKTPSSATSGFFGQTERIRPFPARGRARAFRGHFRATRANPFFDPKFSPRAVNSRKKTGRQTGGTITKVAFSGRGKKSGLSARPESTRKPPSSRENGGLFFVHCFHLQNPFRALRRAPARPRARAPGTSRKCPRDHFLALPPALPPDPWLDPSRPLV